MLVEIWSAALEKIEQALFHYSKRHNLTFASLLDNLNPIEKKKIWRKKYLHFPTRQRHVRLNDIATTDFPSDTKLQQQEQRSTRSRNVRMKMFSCKRNKCYWKTIVATSGNKCDPVSFGWTKADKKGLCLRSQWNKEYTPHSRARGATFRLRVLCSALKEGEWRKKRNSMALGARATDICDRASIRNSHVLDRGHGLSAQTDFAENFQLPTRFLWRYMAMICCVFVCAVNTVGTCPFQKVISIKYDEISGREDVCSCNQRLSLNIGYCNERRNVEGFLHS